MATKEEKTEPKQGLVTLPPSALTKRQDLPDYLREGGTLGMEEVESSDLVLPRFVLCQSGTPERKKTDPKFIEGLEEGWFFNNVTKKIYGETLRVIPVKFFKSRIKFFPLDDGGGIDCQSLNGIDGGHYSPTCAACQYKGFSNGEKPGCFEFQNRVAISIPDGDVGVVSMKSTAIPVSKQWTAISKMRNAPLFSAIYELKGVPAVRGGNNFFAYTQRMVQNCSPEDFKHARALYDAISEKTVVVEQEAPTEESTDFPTTSTEM